MPSKLELNWKFLVDFYATFAPLGVPTLAKWKAPVVCHIHVYLLFIWIPSHAAFFFAGPDGLLRLCSAIWLLPGQDDQKVDQGRSAFIRVNCLNTVSTI